MHADRLSCSLATRLARPVMGARFEAPEFFRHGLSHTLGTPPRRLGPRSKAVHRGRTPCSQPGGLPPGFRTGEPGVVAGGLSRASTTKCLVPLSTNAMKALAQMNGGRSAWRRHSAARPWSWGWHATGPALRSRLPLLIIAHRLNAGPPRSRSQACHASGCLWARGIPTLG